jgi:thioesterase DpgC
MDSLVSAPVVASGDFSTDAARFSAYWRDAKQQLARLPAKPKRDAAAHDAAETLKQAARDARFAFLRRHARTLYDRLTDGRRKFVRVEQLVYDAADAVPGLTPPRAEVSAEADLRQAEKDGCEIDQGILCNQFLADPACGLHLCHAMLLPREESAEALAKFLRDGRLDLGFARVERHGKAAVLLLANKRFLNSEDNSTQPATEIAADVCILDPQSQVAVLRGDVVPDGKYAGQRVYNAGINLTHLYYGKIPFLWFLVRDLGFVNKMLRGLAKPEVSPDEVSGESIEKLWISADPFGNRLQHRRARRLPHFAGAQGRHHPGHGQSPAGALRRRPHCPSGDHVRAPHRVRLRCRPHDLRRGHRARRHGRHHCARHRPADRLWRRGLDRQSPRA